ncbi:hypothetical protein ANCDUO_00272 [Ancylostoma duodenale]|uniref:Uncharacterized protein n=1 Tax=Ancylostoma duodenale TaxID=51022 RepID=A0A0C2DHH0_9BILA|nr:hypothetical protein ANCDUO_00272 [Ancylostoma duodenale]
MKMCEIDHDNVNRFIGLTIHGANYLTLWKFCSRGSLRSSVTLLLNLPDLNEKGRIRTRMVLVFADVIAKGSANMDGFFMYCLVREIANNHGLITRA